MSFWNNFALYNGTAQLGRTKASADLLIFGNLRDTMNKPESMHSDAAVARSWFGNEIAAMLRLAIPIILAAIAIQLMQTADLMMLGRLSPEALAAAALGYNLYVPLYLFGVGLVSALAPIAARIRGGNQGDAVSATRTATQQTIVSIGFICAPAWLALWHAERIFIVIGQEPSLSAESADYLRSLQWALAPMLAFYSLRSVFAALDRTGPTLVATLVGVLVKAFTSYLFIFGHAGFPAMGASGAGLSTCVSGVSMLLVLVAYAFLDRRLRPLSLLGGPWKFDPPVFLELLRLGLPFAILMTLEVSFFAVSVQVMGLFGNPALAAHAIVLNLATLAFMVPLGLAQAATVRVGLAFGARSPVGMSRAGWTALGLATFWAFASAAVMMVLPRFLLQFFVDLDIASNSQIVSLTMNFLFFAALFQFFDAGQVVLSNMLRGITDVRVPMLLSFAGYWLVGMPVGLWLAFRTAIGPSGIWIGLALGLAAVTLSLLARWRLREVRDFY